MLRLANDTAAQISFKAMMPYPDSAPAWSRSCWLAVSTPFSVKISSPPPLSPTCGLKLA